MAHVAASPSDLSGMLQSLMQNHPAIQSKRNGWQAAQDGVTIAERQFWPTPSVSANQGPANYKGSDRAVTASVSVPIYTGGQLTADLDAAQLRAYSAKAEVELAARELSLQFVEIYRLWWLHSAQVNFLKTSLEKMTQLHGMVQKRSTAGVSAQVDALQAQTQWRRLQQDLALAQQQQQQDLTQMAALAGEALAPAFVALDAMPSPIAMDMSAVQDRVLWLHPQLFLAENERALALATLKKIEGSMLPSVSLRIEKQRGSYLGALEAGSRTYLSTQLQLGAGLSTLTMAQQASARAASAQDQIEVVRKQLQEQTLRLWNDEQQAMAQRHSLQVQLASQILLVDAGVRLFQAGRRSWQDLLSLTREWHQLQLQLIEVESAILASRLRLQLLSDLLPGFTVTAVR